MAQEIEFRYLVPDPIVFDRLRRSQRLDGLGLDHRAPTRLKDTYLDTPGRALMRQGYACRIRRAVRSTVVTLKGPRQGTGAGVERPEWEVSLADYTVNIERWPDGELRTRVQELTGGSALVETVALRQRRCRALVRDGERRVAELCLDVVRIGGNGLEHTSLMVEIELSEGGHRADLERLDAILVEDWGLVREPRSKFQRALALVETSELLDADLWQRVSPASPKVVAMRYGADLARARKTAAFAGRLHELLGPACALTEHHRSLLEAAAWLHHVGRASDPKNGLTGARDLMLRQPLTGLSDSDRQAVVGAILLQRGKITPDRIASAIDAGWPEPLRQDAMTVAALLRLAVALRRELPDADAVLEARPVDGGLRVLLHSTDTGGADARRAAERAAKRADLWQTVSSVRLEWAAVQHSEDGEALSLARPADLLGLKSQDAMPTVARKVLTALCGQLLEHEAGTLTGQDPQARDGMRVTIRRLGVALYLLEPYLDMPRAEAISVQLRRLERLLGAVHDLDAAMTRAERYRETLPAADASGLEPLLSAWQRKQALAQRNLLRYLDSRAYARFREHLAVLLDTLQPHDVQAPEDQRAGLVARWMVYLRWQATRNYSAVIPHATAELLHLLRSDCQRLRYALEFFSDLLPREISALVHEVAGLQDHLGAIGDDRIAIEMMDSYLERPRARRTQQAVLAYREACEVSRAALDASLPTVWAHLHRGRVARRMERLIRESGH